MRRRRLLLLSCLLLFVGGCATLDAWRSNLSFNHKTGQLDADSKGAAKGGQYNENTGLNMTWGDNSLPALLIAGVLGTGVIFAYPIQRALRLRKEREILKLDGERNKKAS